jgi:iron complex outermembrane receptor protein
MIRKILNARTTMASALALMTVLPAGHAAQAQVTGAETSGQLEEIVVTAQRYSQNLQSVPVAVSAFSAQTLTDRQVSNVKDAAVQIPGILITTTTGVSDGARIFLRGIGQDNGGLLFDPAVGVYVDGVYYPRINGALFDFFDVGSFEVLRGPQGTLYGRNTDGGAIKIETKRPSFDLVGSGEFAYGNYNSIDARGYISGGIIEDVLAFSVSGLVKKRDGLTYSSALHKDVNDKDTVAGRFKLLYTPTDKLEIMTTVDFEKDNSDPFVGVPVQVGTTTNDPLAVAGRNLFTTELGGQTLNKLDSRGISLNAKYSLTDEITLNSISGYRELHNRFIVPLALSGTANIGSEFNIEETSASQELNATINSDKVKGVAGIYWFREYGNDHQYAIPSEFITASYRTRATQSLAAYTQDSYEFYDGISLVGGVRYTYERDDFLQYYPTLLPYGQSGGKNFYSFTPKLGLDWQVTDGLLAYFSYTKGFKSGGWNPISPTAGPRPLPYSPEKVDSYELGAKFESSDKTLRFNAALFRAEYDSLQLPVFFPGTVNSYTSNTGGARVQGLELEPNWKITSEIELYSAVSFQTGHYTSAFVCADGFNRVVNCENRQLKGLIPVKAATGFTYSPKLDIPGQFRLTGEWDHTDSYWNNVSNTISFEQTPVTDLFNAGLSYETEDGAWTVTVEGKNLTDVHYYPTVLQLGNAVRPSITVYPADPATYDVRVKYSFGPVHDMPTTAAYVPPPVAAPKPAATARSYQVFFDFNKSDLTPQAVAIVDTAAKNAGPAKVTEIEVTGHTDTVGSDAYNMRLSRRRAEAVATELEKQGIPSSEIAIFAKGKKDLLVPTADGVKEPQNRRVQIVYAGGPSS